MEPKLKIECYGKNATGIYLNGYELQRGVKAVEFKSEIDETGKRDCSLKLDINIDDFQIVSADETARL